MSELRQSSFHGGEVSPSFYEQFDLERFPVSARVIKNLVPTKAGTLVKRPGFAHVAKVTSDTIKSRLRRFDFSDDQNFALEFGDRTLKVYAPDGTQKTIYEPPSFGVLVGDDFYRSTDGGHTWVGPVTLPGAGGYLRLAQGPSGWVAVGKGIFAYSADGVTWSAGSPGTTDSLDHTFILNNTTPFYVKHITGTTFVMLGIYSLVSPFTYATVAAHTTDGGATWRASYGWGIPADWFTHCASRSTRVLAAGSNGGDVKIRISTDGGANWGASATAFTKAGYTVQQTELIAESGTVWLLAAHMTKGPDRAFYIYRSADDGVNWTEVYARTGLPAGSELGIFCEMGVGGALVFALANAPYAAVSANGGTTWLDEPFPELTAFVRPIVLGGGAYYFDEVERRFIFVGSTGYGACGAELPGNVSDIAGQGGAAILSFATPYYESALSRLRLTQSGDTVFITSPKHRPYKLVRTGFEPSFVLLTAQPVAPPAPSTPALYGANNTADGTHPAKSWSWVVAWEDSKGVISPPSEPYTLATAVLYPDRPLAIEWTAVDGAVRYHIYRGRNGEYGWVGSSKTFRFQDDGQLPLLTQAPRTWDEPFGDPPAVAAFYQDRFMVANTRRAPATVRGSATGDYFNFDSPLIKRDDNAVEFTLASRQYEEIRALVPMRRLLALTSTNEWSISGTGMDPLSYRSVDAALHGSYGSAWVEPVIAGDACLFVQVQGAQLRELLYDAGSDRYQSTDLSFFAGHLFQRRKIVDIAYCAHPHSILWAVTDDGGLYSCTYVHERQMFAWARHDVGGAVTSCCTINDGREDTLWIVVQRGGTRYIERQTPFYLESLAHGCFLDGANLVVQTASTTVSVLKANSSIQPGDTVYALADGVVRGPLTAVDQGISWYVTLPVAASRIWVGRLMTSEFESLDFPAGVIRQKNLARTLVQYSSPYSLAASGAMLLAGEDNQHLQPRTVNLEDNKVEILVDSVNNPGGRCVVQINDPVPLEILAVLRELVVGE